MSQFPGQDQWGQWNTGPIIQREALCVISWDPVVCGNKETSGPQPQDTKLAALKHKHQTTALLIALAIVISIYVYKNR